MIPYSICRPKRSIRLVTFAVIYGLGLVLSGSASAQSRAEKAQAEWDRLHEMQQTMSAPEYVGRNVDADLAAVTNLEQYRKHFKSLRDEFAAEIKDDQQPFRNLGYKLEHLERQLAEFERAAREFGSVASIEADCDHMLKMAKQAVEYQAPAYFRPENDIAKSTESAKIKLRYMQALSPKAPEVAQSLKRMADTQKEVSKIRQELAASILEQNELPPDEYRGNDRESLVKLMTAEWNKSGAKGKILKVGFIQSDWTRSVTWEIQNRTLYKNDRSHLQGYLIVSFNTQVAARHTFNLYKDHLSNDKLSGSFLEDPKVEPELMNQIMMQKLK